MRNSAASILPALCERLAEAGFLHRAGEHWHWTQEAYPADTVSLRAVTSDNFVIVDTTGEPKVIGEVDFSSALTTVHPKAIYLHQGQQYHVEALDFDERKAYVKRVDVDYYTDAIRYTQVRVLEVARQRPASAPASRRRTPRARTATCWFVRRWWASRRSNSSPTKMSARASSNFPKTKCTRPRSGSRSSARWWSRCPSR